MRYGFEDFELDLNRRELRRGSEVVHVERQVFQVLLYLIEHADRVVSKDELIDAVWEGQVVSESALTSRIKSARAAIGDDGRTQRWIKTLHGIGYRFVGAFSKRSPAETDNLISSNRPELPSLATRLAVDAELGFSGRQEVLADTLRAVTEAARAERAGAWLIGGVAGIGKSRLAIEIAERAAAELDARVFAGRSDQLMTTPLEPWSEILHQCAVFEPERSAEWARGLEEALGGLTSALASLLDVPYVPVEPFRAVDALVTFVDRMATAGPVVLVLDDVHWSDGPTRSAAAQMLRRAGHRPITLLCTYRTTAVDLPEGARGWMAELLRYPQATEISLGPLLAAEAEELAGRCLPDRARAAGRTLFEQTEGHTLFLVEALRDHARGASETELPRSISDLIAARLTHLPAAARTLVEAGAILGHTFALEAASGVAGQPMADALASADAAIRADLLLSEGTASSLRFSHQLVPRVIRETLTAPARCALHRRCADVLESTGGDEAEIAVHWLGAVPLAPVDQVIPRARDAARGAARRLHYDRAVALFDRMLEVDLEERLRTEIQIEYGRILNSAGRGTAAFPHFDAAWERARERRWHDLMLEVALHRGGASPFRGPADPTTLEIVGEVLASAGDLSALDRARLNAREAAFRTFTWRFEQRDTASASALEAGLRAGANEAQRLELYQARWVAIACPLGAGRIRELDSHIGSLSDGVERVAFDAAAAEVGHLWSADGDAFRREAKRFLVDEAVRRELDAWRFESMAGSVAFFEGHTDDARAAFDEASALAASAWGESGGLMYACAMLACDALDPTASSLVPLERLFEASGAGVLRPCVAWARLLNGDEAGAREMMKDFRVASIDRYPEHLLGGNCLVAAAEVACGLQDDALQVATDRALRRVSHLVLGLPWSPSFAAADVLALLAWTRGESEEAVRFSELAAERYAALGAPALARRLEARTA